MASLGEGWEREKRATSKRRRSAMAAIYPRTNPLSREGARVAVGAFSTAVSG